MAIVYGDGEVAATIYIRENDPSKFGSPSALLADSLSAVKALEESGTYSNVKIYESADDSQTSGWAKGAFTARFSGSVLMSLIYVTIKGGYGVKLRITTPNPKNEAIQKFVGEFQRIVDEAKPKPTKSEAPVADATCPPTASFERVVLAYVLFLVVWILTEVIVTVIIESVFPSGQGTRKFGIGLNWRLLPGMVLGFLLACRTWRWMIDDHVDRLRKKEGRG